nr:craniofacial development protein 2 [Tanacetum cinerariifolium]
MSETDSCSISLFPISSIVKLSPSIVSSVRLHREAVNVPLDVVFKQYRRLTVVVETVVQGAVLNSGNPVLKSYDLVAVRPLRQEVFDLACKTYQVDIIAIDFSETRFRLKQPLIKSAIERGVYFELTYSGLVLDPQLRRQIISNAKYLWLCLCEGRIEVLGSDGNLRSCLSGPRGLGGYSESRSGRSGSRVTAFRRIRVGSWNVGSLTSKLLELVDALERHRVDIACFQETKWKGSSNKEVNGYKLWYSGSQTARNGFGVILRACLKDKVVHVNRCNDRIISLTLVIEGETVNVISAYTHQVGLSEEEKDFWDSLDEIVRETPTDQRLILGGDLNGHIGATTEGYSGVHGGFGYGVRNEEGRSILDFATAHDLAVVNSYFKKRDHHLITFQSGGRCTQIDYLLLAMDALFKRVQRRRVRSAAPRILWKNLNGDAAEAFRSRVSEGVSAQIEAISVSDANSMWNILASIIKDATKDSLGVAIGTSKTYTARRVSWWLCEEVQSKVTEKQEGLKSYLRARKRGIKLLSHTMKLWERVVERRLRRETSVSENQFGFMPGRSSIEAIHLIRSLMEKYRERQRDLHLAFIDLEKAPHLFALILDELSRGILDDIPWCMIFADDIVLVSESAEGLNDRLENWREALEANGLRVSREKTKYLSCDFSNSEIAHNEEVKVCIGDKILQPMEFFRYLGSILHKSGRIDEDVAHRIKAAWLKMEVAELRMLRLTCGKTMLDTNGVYRAELEVETIINKMREGRLRWFGHVRRRPQSAPVRRVEALVVDGMRRRGRPKLRWEDKVKLDMKELLLSEDMTSDRNEWRARTSLEG